MTDVSGFIWQHREDDPAELALSGKKHPGLPMAFVARQVEALQKIRRKVPAWYRPGITFPVRLSLEQASSEACARFKAALFSGHSMVDLTCGMGVDVSFFAQNFEQATAVEQSEELTDAARGNFEALELHNIQVLHNFAEQFLEQTDKHFDLIYLDPARRDAQQKKVFNWADCTPNVLDIKDLLFQHTDRVLIKSAPVLDIRLAVRQLGQVQRVWVVEWAGEVREVLYELGQQSTDPENIPITVVVLNAEGAQTHALTFSWEQEAATTLTFGPVQTYLYEPYPAVIKSGAFKTFAAQFGLIKLHANTHLYSSEKLITDIPARVFQVQATCKYDKKSLNAHLSEPKANVATRNFPDSAEQVRKKLGLKDGGDTYVFAATDHAENLQLIVCRKG